MKFHCCELRRLETLKGNGSANAIEFLEVLDLASPPGAPRQQTLFIRLLRPGFALTPDNLRISGGERIKSAGIVWCAAADALPPEAEPNLVDTVDDLPRTLVVRTNTAGDFSTYTFSIVANSGSDNPPAGFDPKLSSIDFSFKVECPTDFDCAREAPCPPDAGLAPEIDYFAKDYQGFRRLMLDRLNLLVPAWTERSPADLGVALVELIAYAADNLSYRQDSIANEAYLATARQRISVRRHGRLVDYLLHEGCNARAYVHFDVVGQNIALARGTQLLTSMPNLPVVITPGTPELREAINAGALVFETAQDAVLDEQLNQLSFYSWGDEACCLLRGATGATLRGHLVALHVGDILIFQEVVSPTTFLPEDADRSHRWAVRLTGVTLSTDPSGQLFDNPPVDGPADVTEIIWDAADALPFQLCLSVAEREGLEISIALGNIVIADHGRTIADEPLGRVPAPTMAVAQSGSSDCCDKPDAIRVQPRFRPALSKAPLTHGFDVAALLGVPISPDEAWWPASTLLTIDPRTATPRIAKLLGTLGAVPESWTPRRDLMASGPDAADFVVEIDNDATARLRFGDDARGKRPDPDTEFIATYRIGNGKAGNAGAESIRHIVSILNGTFTAVTNPLAATGGIEPEDIESARRDAPQAFRTQERAVIAADYAAAAERLPEVPNAAAAFRWTGSWYTVFVTPDRIGGADVDALFAARLRRHLERFRMAGYDLEISPPRYVPLDVALHICVKPDYFRSDVLEAVEEVLSSAVLPDGRLGLFHPDNFSFGQPVYLSPIIAAAQAVEGVDSVKADTFERLSVKNSTALADGVIPVGGLEIAQLANNPNFRERGRITILAGGGK